MSESILDELNKAKSDLSLAENQQKTMKDVNAIIRSKKDVLNRIIALGISESTAQKLLEPDFAKRIGFPTYKLTNNNANIKRLQDRVNMLQKKWEGAKEDKKDEYVFSDGTFLVNYEIDRIQIFYNGKPDNEVRTSLKKNGWNWSPTNGAWQRKITPQAISNAIYLTKATKPEGESKQSSIKTLTIEQIDRRNFCYVSANGYAFRDELGDIPGSNNLTFICVVGTDIGAEARKMVKELFAQTAPNFDVEKLSISVYPKTYVRQAKQLFDEGRFIPGGNPIKIFAPLIQVLNFADQMKKEKQEVADPVEQKREELKNTKAQDIADNIKEYCKQTDLPQPDTTLTNNATTVFLDWGLEKVEIIIDVDSPIADGILLKKKGFVIENFKISALREALLKLKEVLQVNEIKETIVSESLVIAKPETDFKGINFEYKNQYLLNKAIEALLTEKGTKHEDYTSDEKNFIRKYSGYGGLDQYGKTGKGGLFEYYTPQSIIAKMWALAYKHGYNNGPILEPSVATGEFLQYAKPGVRTVGYEISEWSAKICRILYPTAEIILQPFEQTFIKNNFTIKDKIEELEKFDLAIGNPPYGDFSIVESRYMSGMGEKDHVKPRNYVEYFIRRSVDLLNKDGLLVFIVGSQVKAGGIMFLDSGPSVVKDYLAQTCEFLESYRLPNSVFERTGVTSDIIVLKKTK